MDATALLTHQRTMSTTENIEDRRRACRTEWRQLCDALEFAQGEELGRICRNKFQFVKTYRTYGRDFDRLAAELKSAAAHGQYSFFADRGVPKDVLSPSFIEVLLEDWKSAIDAKKRHVSEIFRLRFREEIEMSMMTGEEAMQLGAAESLHKSDAVLNLSGLAKPAVTFDEITELRAEIKQLREQLDGLRKHLQQEIDTLKAKKGAH